MYDPNKSNDQTSMSLSVINSADLLNSSPDSLWVGIFISKVVFLLLGELKAVIDIFWSGETLISNSIVEACANSDMDDSNIMADIEKIFGIIA
jgi:hypothetical protein